MGLTTDRNDPDLGHGSDDKPTEQNETYLAPSDEEKAKGFVRPVRRTYTHKLCGEDTTMGLSVAETYARDPKFKFHGSTYCTSCQMYRAIGEFTWKDTDERVGS